jgi:hypothetical protein
MIFHMCPIPWLIPVIDYGENRVLVIQDAVYWYGWSTLISRQRAMRSPVVSVLRSQ